MQKRLARSQTDRRISGVCGGLGELFGIESSGIRLGFVLFGLFGAGVLVYFILAFIVPDEAQY